MNKREVNLPAISDANTMVKYPDVRNAERDTLIESLEILPGMRVLDIQSAGGYLSDEIYRRLGGNVTCICLEPSETLRQRLNPNYIAIDNPVEHFTSIESNSLDAALGLAGLHHSNSHLSTLKESFRVLKPGGQLAICDVLEDSDIAKWLNEFVHTNNSTGHTGNFVQQDKLAKLFSEAGFCEIEEIRKSVPWIFDSREQTLEFFKGLFDLQCSKEEISTALDKYFNCSLTNDSFAVDWTLLYCTGKKPVRE